MVSKHVGELEHLVLLSVVRLGAGAYGMAVLRELETRADRKVSRGALYLVLERLVQKGYLGTRMGDPSPERGGAGQALLRADRQRPCGPARVGQIADGALGRPRAPAGGRSVSERRPPTSGPAGGNHPAPSRHGPPSDCCEPLSPTLKPPRASPAI